MNGITFVYFDEKLFKNGEKPLAFCANSLYNEDKLWDGGDRAWAKCWLCCPASVKQMLAKKLRWSEAK